MSFIEVDNQVHVNAANFLNEDLSNIYNWQGNGESISLQLKLSHLNPQIHFKGKVIEEVDSNTHLGVRIAKNLRWSLQINIFLKARKIIECHAAVKIQTRLQIPENNV